MRWEGRERSDNVIDSRGRSRGRGLAIGGGAGGLILVVLALIMGVDPRQFLNDGPAPVNRSADPQDDKLMEFCEVILRDTEIIWDEQFQQLGRTYRKPTLNIFAGQVNTGCGSADSGVGPFYCPADSTVYIDLEFFRTLERDLRSPGDFARAYVLAHEVGHHVQRLLGYSARVDDARRTMSKTEYNKMSVRLELQADFLAGVWAHHAQKRFQFLEKGDLESATNAAYHIGDDHLQKQARGRVQPDSFTHGTSRQRQRWFLEGFNSGDLQKARLLFDMNYPDL